MERRFLLGLAILLLVLSFAIGTSIGMKAIHAPGEVALTQAAQHALAGNMDQAIPLAQEAYRSWKRFQGITAAFADHTPMENINGLFAQL